jgi:hypothetical protein
MRAIKHTIAERELGSTGRRSIGVRGAIPGPGGPSDSRRRRRQRVVAATPRRDPPGATWRQLFRTAASSSDDHDDAGAAKFGANLTDGDY